MIEHVFMPIGIAARRVGLSVEYFRHLADAGRIPCVRDPYMRRLFAEQDVRDLERARSARAKPKTKAVGAR